MSMSWSGWDRLQIEIACGCSTVEVRGPGPWYGLSVWRLLVHPLINRSPWVLAGPWILPALGACLRCFRDKDNAGMCGLTHALLGNLYGTSFFRCLDGYIIWYDVTSSSCHWAGACWGAACRTVSCPHAVTVLKDCL